MSLAESPHEERVLDAEDQVDLEQLTSPPNKPQSEDPTVSLRWWRLLALMLLPIAIVSLVYLAVKAAANDSAPSVVDSGAMKRVRVGVRQVGSIESPQMATRFRGVVMPRRESSLSFRRSGPVQSILVDAGDALKAGETIAILDTSDLAAQADLSDSELRVAKAQFDEAIAGPRKQTIAAAEARVDQLKAQLTASKNRLRRREMLVKSRAASREELQDAQQATQRLIAATQEADSQLRELVEGTRSEQVQAAKARVDMAAASRRMIDVQIKDSQIVAPFDCVITERFIDEGSVVGPDQTVVSIAEQPPLEANFGVPATAAAKLSMGDDVTISVGKNALVRQQAAIVRMQPRVDPITRTRELVVQFDTDEVSLIGQPATLWLSWEQLEQDQVTDDFTFWIPSDALVRSVRGLWAIYVARADEPSDSEANGGFKASVALLDAKIIKTAGTMTLVTASLTDRDWIITEGVHRVAPGVEVVGVDGSSSLEVNHAH